jgi:sec-independent protein translocase protein TatB
MFDFDIGKMMVVAIVALAVIPPKDLPRVMRTVGQMLGRMRRMASEFQGQFMDAMREADLDSVRKELAELNDKAKINAAFDPVSMVKDDVTKAAEKAGIGTSEVALSKPSPMPEAEAAGPALPAPVETSLAMVTPDPIPEPASLETAPTDDQSAPPKQSAAE